MKPDYPEHRIPSPRSTVTGVLETATGWATGGRGDAFSGRPYIPRGAFSAEFRGRSVFEAALAAPPSKWRCAFVAELEACRIFRTAFRATHVSPRRHFYSPNSASNALASFRSAVSKPSVNPAHD